MLEKNLLIFSANSTLSLNTFSLFPEYFVSLSAIYATIVAVIVIFNVCNITIQRALSECFGLTLLMTCYLIYNDDILTSGSLILNGSIVNDSFGFLTKILVCFFSSLFFFVIADSLDEQKLTQFEYLLILFLSVLGLMLLCSSNDLLTAYLAIELTSLSSYLLASFRKTSSYSIEAGLKYFITGAVSSALFLIGSSFLYAYSGSIYLADYWDLFTYGKESINIGKKNFHNYYLIIDNLYGVIEVADLRDIPEPVHEQKDFKVLIQLIDWISLFGEGFHNIVGSLLLTELAQNSVSSVDKESLRFIEIGMTAVIFSLFIKLALAPFHLWSLDVYEGSPTNSTFFFAVITKLSIFAFLVRFCYVGMYNFSEAWQFYSLWVAIFSVLVGSFGGLKQRKIKTLLAYSSVSHMGYALLAFSNVSAFGVRTLLFYLIIYMISGICTWFIIILLRLKPVKATYKYNKELGDLAALNKSNSAIAFGLALTMFSLAGLPPLVGFLAKIGVFLSLLKEKFYVICVLAILCSVISTFYYIRIVKILYFENLLVGKLYYPIKTNKTLILSTFIFLLVALFINPSLLFLLVHNTIFDFLILSFDPELLYTFKNPSI